VSSSAAFPGFTRIRKAYHAGRAPAPGTDPVRAQWIPSTRTFHRKNMRMNAPKTPTTDLVLELELAEMATLRTV